MQPNTDPAYLASQGLSATVPKRFMRHIAPPNENGCIEWTGFRHKGYGQINTGIPPYRPTRAHIVSYVLFVGPIPDGMNVLHKCPGKHNRACVNPNHLTLGTQSENMRDRYDQVKNGFREATLRPLGIGAKLTPEQRDEIRAKHAAGGRTQWSLAHEYGVSQGTIWNVLNHIGG